MAIYQHIRHPRIAARRADRPVKVMDLLPHGTPVARFNQWFAVKITTGVGTMWCAYAFAALALVSLPSAIASGSAVTLVSWISQTFLQLVLLSVIIAVGAVRPERAAAPGLRELVHLAEVVRRGRVVDAIAEPSRHRTTR